MGGKHRAPRTPSNIGPTLAKAGAVALAATGPIALSPSIAFASTPTAEVSSSSILEVIAKCESGNKNVNTLGGSTASGYLQILDSTWKAFGGTQFASRAIHASREEQFIVGARVLAGQGISAWNPSRGCWGNKVGSAKKVVPVETPAVKKVTTPAPKVVKKKKEAPKVVKKSVAATSAPKTIKKQTPPPTAHVAKKAAASYLIHRGDSLSKIAAAQHVKGGWKALFAANRDTVRNPNLIYAGNHLRLG